MLSVTTTSPKNLIPIEPCVTKARTWPQTYSATIAKTCNVRSCYISYLEVCSSSSNEYNTTLLQLTPLNLNPNLPNTFITVPMKNTTNLSPSSRGTRVFHKPANTSPSSQPIASNHALRFLFCRLHVQDLALQRIRCLGRQRRQHGATSLSQVG